MENDTRTSAGLRELLLDAICDGCHHPHVAEDQSDLDARCELCPIEAMLDALIKIARTEGSIETLHIVKEEMLRTIGGDYTCT